MGNSIGPPMCALCRVAHWLRDPHVFAGEKQAKTNVTQPKTDEVALRKTVEELRARIAELEGKLTVQREANAARVRAHREKAKAKQQ